MIDASVMELIKQVPNLAIAVLALTWLATVAGRLIKSQADTVTELIAHQKTLIDRLLVMSDEAQRMQSEIADVTIFRSSAEK